MNWTWISHSLSNDTPLYRGAQNVAIRRDKSMSSGDSCNTMTLTLPNHTGSHVDAPYHFVADGKTIDSFTPESWIFLNPLLIAVNVKPGELITPDKLMGNLEANQATDIILLQSGFEAHRGSNSYWKNSPGISPKLKEYLKSLYPKMRAIGIDCISISSLKHRETGRSAHKVFLDDEILLFEDLALSNIPADADITQIIALPLRIEGGDGAPCTIICQTN